MRWRIRFEACRQVRQCCCQLINRIELIIINATVISSPKGWVYRLAVVM
jgi:hypothetical protein